jgi:hypothetical protein
LGVPIFCIVLTYLYLCVCSSKEHATNNHFNFIIMTNKPKTGANWLQRQGTFCVKCSRYATEYLTINQKGGVWLL